MITLRFHYIFDAWGLDPKFLNSKRLVTSLLEDIAKICKMNIIGGPLVVKPPAYTPPGVSGFCIIDFSHISIHTFSERGEVCVDVFSCKSFEPEEVKAYLLKKLKVDERNLYFFKVNYPKEISAKVAFVPVRTRQFQTI